MRASLLEFGRSETDGDFFGGEIEVGTSNRGADALTGLGNGFAGHADDVETGKTICCSAFDFDEVAVVAVGDGGIYFCDHSASI